MLYNKILENSHEVVLLGIGNIVRITELFQEHPDSQSLLRGLYIMNEYFDAVKIPRPNWNWNSWTDRLALKEYLMHIFLTSMLFF